MALLKQKINSDVSFSVQINNYLGGLKDVIDEIDERQIQVVMEKLIDCYERDGFVYIFGNGGSGTTASHFVNDFNKVASENLSRKFRFCCLNDNVATIMSIANDIGYSQVFKLQLENFLTSKDLVIGISGSGNSPNVLHAIEYANACGAETIGLVGFDGGKLMQIAKHSIHVPVNYMQYVEDMHLILNHLIMSTLKGYLENGL